MIAGRFGAELVHAAAVALLAIVVVVASAFLWIGLPLAGLWLAGELTTTTEGFMFATVGGIPPAMVGFGWLLYRLGALYERLRGHPAAAPTRSAWLVSNSDERGRLRRARAGRPLVEVAVTASAVLALALMAFWFVFLAESPLAPLP